MKCDNILSSDHKSVQLIVQWRGEDKMDLTQLENLRSKLANLLPSSVQVYNLITLMLSQDAMARQVIVREGSERSYHD